MTNNILFAITLLFVLSCKKDDSDGLTKQGNGNVWLSGGLAVCAEQIHLDNGVTLIVNPDDVFSFQSGDRVEVKYKETGVNKACSPGISCEIIEIKKIVGEQTINISAGDIFNLNLGSFGDEEGAWIYLNPLHAKVNLIVRQVNSSEIYYKYSPLDDFTGKDSVDIITDTGSDGSIGTGKLDTLRLRFIIQK